MARMMTIQAALIATVIIHSVSWAGEKVFFQRKTFDPLQSQTQLLQLEENSRGSTVFSESYSNLDQDLLVQFHQPVSFQEQKQMKSFGLKVLGYLPEDVLVVRGSWSLARKAQAQNKNIRAITPYPAEVKLSLGLTPMSVFSVEQTHKYLIQTFTAEDAKKVAHLIDQKNYGLVLSSEGKSILLQTAEKNILAIAGWTGVEHIQEPVAMKTMDMDLSADAEKPSDQQTLAAGDYSDLVGNESGHSVMRFNSIWSAGYKGQGQIASMADTGLDTGDLNTISADFKNAIVDGEVFAPYGKSWEDPMGHGTHVAGSIVGRGVVSSGKIHGGATEAGFVAQSIWSPMMNNLMLPSKLGSMFGKAYEKGARVHSNSWGGGANFGAYDNFASQVDDFMFQNQEMLIIFAAGNSGVDKNKDGRIDANSMASPGTAKNALTVGASKNVTSTGGIQKYIRELRSSADNWPAEPILSSKLSENENGMAMFSSRGPTTDGRIKPDICAPGTNILSDRSHNPKAEALWGAYNADYAWSGGTSMATPLVAGAATVTRQMLQDKYKVASPSAALLKAVLMNTATDMFPGQFGEVGAAKGQELLTQRPNSDEGYGRVNMDTIMQRALVLFDDTVGVAQGETKTYDFDVKQDTLVTINMVYTDAPGSTNAARALVNDLDISLVDSQGQILANPADHTNNHEYIQQKLNAGHYQLKVNGARVPQGKAGKQSFALVVGL